MDKSCWSYISSLSVHKNPQKRIVQVVYLRVCTGMKQNKQIFSTQAQNAQAKDKTPCSCNCFMFLHPGHSIGEQKKILAECFVRFICVIYKSKVSKTHGTSKLYPVFQRDTNDPYRGFRSIVLICVNLFNFLNHTAIKCKY